MFDVRIEETVEGVRIDLTRRTTPWMLLQCILLSLPITAGLNIIVSLALLAASMPASLGRFTLPLLCLILPIVLLWGPLYGRRITVDGSTLSIGTVLGPLSLPATCHAVGIVRNLESHDSGGQATVDVICGDRLLALADEISPERASCRSSTAYSGTTEKPTASRSGAMAPEGRPRATPLAEPTEGGDPSPGGGGNPARYGLTSGRGEE